MSVYWCFNLHRLWSQFCQCLDVRDVAIAANQALMKLITSEDDHMDLNYLKRYDPEFRKAMNRSSQTSSELETNNSADMSPLSTEAMAEGSPPTLSISSSMSSHATGFQLQPVIEVLTLQLLNKSVETRVAVLRWMLNLHNRLPKKVTSHWSDLPLRDNMRQFASDVLTCWPVVSCPTLKLIWCVRRGIFYRKNKRVLAML